MSRRVALALSAFLFFGWAINLAALKTLGKHRELYPFTAYPMFSGSSGSPRSHVIEHLFLVEAKPGDPLREIPGTEMIARHISYGRSRAGTFLAKLADGLERAGANEFERGRAVPGDLATIWLANARDRLGLERAPHAVHFVRRVIPLDQPFDALRERRGTAHTIAIVSSTAEPQ